MLKMFSRALVLFAFLPLVACAESSTDKYVEGKHYVTLPESVETSNPAKVEVLELFWYGCGGCFALEPFVRSWEKNVPADVEFVKMPSMMSTSWRDHAQAFYAAKSLGVPKKGHEKLFDAIHKDQRKLFDLNSLTDFYVANGADRKLFNGKLKSFAVDREMKKAFKKQVVFSKGGVTGVPAIIVNGKYYVSTSMAAGRAGMFDVVDFLVAKERTAKQ